MALRTWQREKHTKYVRSHHHINNRTVLAYHPKWNESQLKFLGQGWFRAAWKLDRQSHAGGVENNIPIGGWNEDDGDDDETIILKMLRPERDFTEEFFELPEAAFSAASPRLFYLKRNRNILHWLQWKTQLPF